MGCAGKSGYVFSRYEVPPVGAREFLVAYNVNLNTTSVRRANEIASRVREQGYYEREGDQPWGAIVTGPDGKKVRKPGRLKHVKGIGWFIEEYGVAQISMNLTNIAATPVHEAFDAVVEEATARGVRVTGSELVGLIPLGAMLDAGRHYLRREELKGEYELREVAYAYEDGGAKVLDLPALRITPGQHMAVLGANGSGKSTPLKLLTGLYAPRGGTLMLDGTDMAQIAPRDLCRLVGYLGQDVRLFAGSLRDNLNLNMLERDDSRLMEALEFAGLGKYVRSHPKGLDLDILDGGQGLSIGQRQSIGWARLWLQNPQICLLDEPTAALDQALESALVGRLSEWLRGRTAIIATHRVPILSLTERALVLNHGRMVVDGPRAEVLAHLNGAKPGAQQGGKPGSAMGAKPGNPKGPTPINAERKRA